MHGPEPRLVTTMAESQMFSAGASPGAITASVWALPHRCGSLLGWVDVVALAGAGVAVTVRVTTVWLGPLTPTGVPAVPPHAVSSAAEPSQASRVIVFMGPSPCLVSAFDT